MSSRSNGNSTYRNAATGRFQGAGQRERASIVKGALKISPFGTMKEVGKRVPSGSLGGDWVNVGRDIRKAMSAERASRDERSN